LCGATFFKVTGTVTGTPCFRWTLADTSLAKVTNPTALNTQVQLLHKSSTPGKITYVKVYLNAWGSCSLAKKDSVVVAIQAAPLADFSIDLATSPLVCFTRKDGGGSQWRWGFQQKNDITATVTRGVLKPDSLTSSNPICRKYPPGTHWVCLEVTDGAGCADTVCKSFVVPPPVVKRDSLIEIANVFTPSEPGDGFNDEFRVPCVGCSAFDIQIYNRWGEKVFQSKDAAVSWNGRVDNKGPKLPSGTYVYTLKYALGSAPIKTLNGTVTLIRKEP
jgi:gliding motility-associated-like protein